MRRAEGRVVRVNGSAADPLILGCKKYAQSGVDCHKLLLMKRAAPTSSDAPNKKRKLAIRQDVLSDFAEPHTNHNENITKILDQMAKIEKNRGQRHKFTAYHVAAQSIGAHPTKIKSAQEAMELDGVGPKIGEKVEEILKTGTSSPS